MANADWEWLEELERERFEMTKKALDDARKGKATPEQMEHLARECGIVIKPRGKKNEPIQPL